MLERWKAVDKAENDPQIQQDQAAYIAGNIEADELDREIGLRNDEILYGPEWDALTRCKQDLRWITTMQTAIDRDWQEAQNPPVPQCPKASTHTRPTHRGQVRLVLMDR